MASSDGHPAVRPATRRVLALLAGSIVIAVIVGMTLLGFEGHRQLDLSQPGTRIAATVVSVRLAPCPGSAPDDRVVCAGGSLRLDDGRRAPIAQLPASAAPDISPGDHVIVTAAPGGGYDIVAFGDRGPLLAGAVAVALLALLLAGGLRGLRGAVALALAGAVIAGFAVPSLLDGRSAVAVAALSGAAIAAALTGVLHGIDARARVAFLGAAGAIGVAVACGDAVRELAHLAGLAEAVPSYIRIVHGRLPADGLLLAGLVVGATGAIVDLAIRQVDATWDLRDAPPTWRGVAAAGLRRSRAAFSGMSTALVLAYAGAALPVFVLVTSGSDGVATSVRGEAIAVEIARAAVGIVGLASVVPLTAAVAAFVVVREARRSEPSDPRRFQSRRERRLWQQEEQG